MREWYTQELEAGLEQQDFSSALAEAQDLSTFLTEQVYTC